MSRCLVATSGDVLCAGHAQDKELLESILRPLLVFARSISGISFNRTYWSGALLHAEPEWPKYHKPQVKCFILEPKFRRL